MTIKRQLGEKLKESLSAVLPIAAIVMVISFTVVPLSPSVLLYFLMGAALVIVGMMFFSLGSELSMTPMGERIGAAVTKSHKLSLIVLLSFLLGFIVTVAEPDLQVLASLVPAVSDRAIIITVSLGVGIFLVIAVLRALFAVPLKLILLISYSAVFILSVWVPSEFMAVSWDSGGVTTGPVTVPFIMSSGAGVAALRSDTKAEEDSFGLVSLCSAGPIIALMCLCMIYAPDSAAYEMSVIPDISDSAELFHLFAVSLPDYAREIGRSILPIVIFFAVFQLLMLKLSRRNVLRIVIGFVYTSIGLILFLTGANVGFMPAGTYLGGRLAVKGGFIIVPAAMLMGYFIVKAEPAVYVLNKQVEDITNGAVNARVMGRCLSVGVSLSLGLALVRVLTGISIMWFIIPGYLFAFIISCFVPGIYTAIAFDSGGVASGPMTAAFLLPFAQGACAARGGDIVADAFGVVAMVAMIPLITVQLMGLYMKFRRPRPIFDRAYGLDPAFAAYTNAEIIEF